MVKHYNQKMKKLIQFNFFIFIILTEEWELWVYSAD